MAHLFENRDDDYHQWRLAHAGGFVLNTHVSPNSSYATLHNSSCPHISVYQTTHQGDAFTGNGYIKVCSLSEEDLHQWVKHERPQAQGLDRCPHCLSISKGRAKRSTVPPQFVINEDYDRRTEIHEPFGGSAQSGISSSSFFQAIFLFTGDTGDLYGYRDGYTPAGTFLYTGEGQVGDMEFSRGNKAINDHATTGRSLHLFEALKKPRKQRYLGEFSLIRVHTNRTGPDRNGNLRKLIIFELRPGVSKLGMTPDRAVPLFNPIPTSLEESREKAIAAYNAQEGKAAKSTIQLQYHRSELIRAYVLKRANGNCEHCACPAPFSRVDGSPYLEVHHVNRLSDGGIDHPKNTAALCPSCHREVHFGQNGDVITKQLMVNISKKEQA